QYSSVSMSFLSFSVAPLAPHSFPTRRSSDLLRERTVYYLYQFRIARIERGFIPCSSFLDSGKQSFRLYRIFQQCDRPSYFCPDRSEEHTSELQSHLNLVCRLLLEKKNKNRYN